MAPQSTVREVCDYLKSLQTSIVDSIQSVETDATTAFISDQWARAEGGGGQSCVLEGGKVFERAGVNFSHVMGANLPPSATRARPELAGASFEAMGVSLVIHPRNPYVPTAHANVRYFRAETDAGKVVWWFGGGFDLTPYYVNTADVNHFHQVAYECCAPFGESVYPKYRNWADEYFYLKHRQEPRGVGGLFFDDLNESVFGWNESRCFEFMQSVGDGFIPAYLPIVQKRHETPFGKRERAFQCYRRGRYVEFNLVYDRGTLFGLQSNGRTESILMSMPPEVHFAYNQQFDDASPEGKSLAQIKSAPQWVSIVS